MAKPVSPSSPTFNDIAERLGVSRTSVSNAFNRPDQLSPELRERILEVARRMDYAGPNPMGRMLRTGRAGAIGLLFSDPLSYAVSDPTAIAFLQGVAQVCTRNKIGLLLIPAMADEAAQKTVHQAAVDGFIIYCLAEDSPVIDTVLERRLPIVAADQSDLPDIPSVGIDDHAAARLAAECLLQLGHRRLAILSLHLLADGHSGWVDGERRQRCAYKVTARRLTGYEDALSAAGLDIATMPIMECPDNGQQTALTAALTLLASKPRPTGILAMSDQLAIGALRAAQQLGIPVPQALSVIGFDDIPLAEQFHPTLTTVHQPLVEKGVYAAERLLNDTAYPDRHSVLATRLIMRDSTGPAPPADVVA